MQDSRIAVLADPDGVVLDWFGNGSLLGWSESMAVGKPLVDFLLPERYREAHRQGLARFAATRQSKLFGHVLQLEALHRDGHEVPILLTLSLVVSTQVTKETALPRFYNFLGTIRLDKNRIV